MRTQSALKWNGQMPSCPVRTGGVLLASWILCLGLFGGVVACSPEAEREVESSESLVGRQTGAPEPAEPVPVPAEYQTGEQLFTKFCAGCHGNRGSGTSQGPPLVHKIYEPSHHSDQAFIRAAAQGVRAHHWKFGNMPKIQGVTTAEVQEIISYVRWLQRQAGIT